MIDALKTVQTAAITVLETHPALSLVLTGVFDGVPPRQPFPYIAVSDGVVTDWSTKTATGRDIRLALTLWDDGEAATRLHDIMAHAEEALAAIPRDLGPWRVASNVFLRSLVARDPAGPWSGLIEQRVRVIGV
jgi:Protein of unknown function (DUF3168)